MVGPLELSPDDRAVRWRVIGSSVRGASHARKGLPNQDAIAWRDGLHGGRAAIMAVSDGHGSSECFRSDRGSKAAVEIAVNGLQNVLRNCLDHPATLSQIRQELEGRLPRQLVHTWSEWVRNDLQGAPFADEELAAVAEKAGASKRQELVERPQLAYGCTLLAVLVTHSFAVYVQLGDGDILAVSEDGRVSRPLEKDSRLIANETTSLCSPDAWKHARVSFEPFAAASPALVLVSSDGYSNSFQDDEAFLQVGRDLLLAAGEQRLEELQNSLEGWLDESSAKGSGDDVTLGIARRSQQGDRDQLASQLAEIKETTEKTQSEIGELGARLTALEDRAAGTQQTMATRLLAVEAIDTRLHAIEPRMAALREVERRIDAGDEQARNVWRRWSVAAAWAALALSGVGIAYLFLKPLPGSQPAAPPAPVSGSGVVVDMTPKAARPRVALPPVAVVGTAPPASLSRPNRDESHQDHPHAPSANRPVPLAVPPPPSPTPTSTPAPLPTPSPPSTPAPQAGPEAVQSAEPRGVKVA